MKTKVYTIMVKPKVFVNRDPQKRCYNGAYADAGYEWGNWEVLESKIPAEQALDRLKFWSELNDYAVSQRGKGAKKQFKLEESLQVS